MPAYVLIDADVTDPVRYKEYLRLGDVAMEAAGGRFLARVCILSFRTRQRHVEDAVHQIVEETAAIRAEAGLS